MARKRIGNEPQTGAEKQKLFRQRMKAKGYTERHIWLPKETPTPDLTGTDAGQATAPPIDADKEARRQQWETELRQEVREARLKAARKAGRESERHKHHERGFVSGVIAAANCFVIGDRYSADIAMMLLHRLGIDRNRATAAGLGNYELSALDKADAWIKPPKTHEA
ncbi:hypothetical protein FACS189494_09350 [Spirochaetia bacterium]|nr:hypothetical protein FACS189494_09350 [Spirochaetia bacterium]